MMPDLLYKMAFASVRGMGVDLAQKILDVLGDERVFRHQREGVAPHHQKQKQNSGACISQFLP